MARDFSHEIVGGQATQLFYFSALRAYICVEVSHSALFGLSGGTRLRMRMDAR